MNILFDGASIAYGSELQGLDDNDDDRIKNRYSQLVSDKLNATYDNISEKGKSNDGILRSTIDYCENNQVDLVVIQFSPYSRTELFTGDRYYNISAASDKIYSKVFFRNIQNLNNAGDNFYKNKFLLEDYLSSNNIKYYFIKTKNENETFYNSRWYNMSKKYKIKSVRDIIGDRRHNPENYCKRFIKKKELRGVHPNKKGHMLICDEIIAYCTGLNIPENI